MIWNRKWVLADEHHSEEVLHTMEWQVNLDTGKVDYLETVDPDG